MDHWQNDYLLDWKSKHQIDKTFVYVSNQRLCTYLGVYDIIYTSVSNNDLDLRNEQSDQVVYMSSYTYRVLKIIHFEITKP